MNISEMVSEYNEIEQEQQARLRAIFGAVKARKGYRHVNFENDVMWSNCWESPDRLDNIFFSKLQRSITEVHEGNE